MADLNETSLEDALINISTLTDDRGLNIALKGAKLIIPPQLVFVADRLLNSPGRLAHLTMTSMLSTILVCYLKDML